MMTSNIFVGINTSTTEFNSNTITPGKMDQMVCNLCHSDLFIGQCLVLHHVSFARFRQSNLYLHYFYCIGCSVGISIDLKTDSIDLFAFKILWYSSNDVLVFSNDYSNERREIRSIQRTKTRISKERWIHSARTLFE